jgi:4-amino-4-deoxyprephenate dehydrogenase
MSFDDSSVSNVVVIGANGGMGRDLRRNFAAIGIPSIGLDKVAGPDVITEDVLALSPAAIELIASASLVILSVSEELAISAAPPLFQYFHHDATFMICTSVASWFREAFQGTSPCAKATINPLFGSGLTWLDRDMVVSPIEDGPGLERWLDAFRRMGLKLIMLDAETHDRLAGDAQAAAHAAIITFLMSVGEESATFSTPPNQLLRLLSARMLSAEAHVYWSIQAKNPFAKAARQRLRNALDHIDDLVITDDAIGFQRIWHERREMLGGQLERRQGQCHQLIEFMNEMEHIHE